MRNMFWSKVPTHEYIQRRGKTKPCGFRKTKRKSKKTTEVVGELELPLEPIVEEGEEDEVRNETNPHLQKGKKANVFNVKIKYPPTDEEKKDIKLINIEDIFPNDIAAPTTDSHPHWILSQRLGRFILSCLQILYELYK